MRHVLINRTLVILLCLTISIVPILAQSDTPDTIVVFAYTPEPDKNGQYQAYCLTLSIDGSEIKREPASGWWGEVPLQGTNCEGLGSSQVVHSPDGSMLTNVEWVSDRDYILEIFDAQTKREIAAITDTYSPEAMTWLPDNSGLLFWDMKASELLLYKIEAQ